MIQAMPEAEREQLRSLLAEAMDAAGHRAAELQVIMGCIVHLHQLRNIILFMNRAVLYSQPIHHILTFNRTSSSLRCSQCRKCKHVSCTFLWM